MLNYYRTQKLNENGIDNRVSDQFRNDLALHYCETGMSPTEFRDGF